MLSHKICITLSHSTIRKLDLKRILALGFSDFILKRHCLWKMILFCFYLSLFSLSLVFKEMFSFYKGQKCYVCFLTYSMWIMFCFWLPEILPILALITQKRRCVIFLHDLLVINSLILFYFDVFSTKLFYRLMITS